MEGVLEKAVPQYQGYKQLPLLPQWLQTVQQHQVDVSNSWLEDLLKSEDPVLIP